MSRIPVLISLALSLALASSGICNSLLLRSLELEARVGIGQRTVLSRVILPDFMRLHKRTLSLFFRAVTSTFAHTFAHSGDCDSLPGQLGTERHVRAGFPGPQYQKAVSDALGRTTRLRRVCVIYVPRCQSWPAVNSGARQAVYV